MIAPSNDSLGTTTCIDVFYRVAVCVAGRAKDAAEPGGEGLILYADELKAIDVNLLPLLRHISGQNTTVEMPRRDLDYWSGTMVRACVRLVDFRTLHIYPGDLVPDGAFIHHIATRPEVCFYPFADIMSAIERLAIRYSVPPESLVFRYRGAAIRDADTIHRTIRIRPGEAQAFADALDRWHEQANRLISPTEANASDSDNGVPTMVRGIKLTRKALMRVVGKTRRTLQNWDAARRGPMGLPWVRGEISSKGRIEYDIWKNWLTIIAIIEREGNRDARWLEARIRAEAERQEKESLLEDQETR